MGGHPTRKRQRVGELIKHLRLLTPPVSGCIAGAQFPLLRTAPTRRGRGRKTSGKISCRKTHLHKTPVYSPKSGAELQSTVSITCVSQFYFPFEAPQSNPVETGPGAHSPPLHSFLSVCFQFCKVGSETSQTDENRMLFMPAAGRLPRSSFLFPSSLYLFLSLIWHVLGGGGHVLTRQKQQFIHGPWVSVQLLSDKHKSMKQLLWRGVGHSERT